MNVNMFKFVHKKHSRCIVNLNGPLSSCLLSKVCLEDRYAFTVRDKAILKWAWIIAVDIISGVVASSSLACEEKKQNFC